MSRICLALLFSLFIAPLASAREWKTIHSGYKIQGDLVAFNDEHVVIKKSNKELISIKIADLSKEDQDYLKSKETEDYLKSEAERVHTWHLKGGLKIVGRVIAFGTRDVHIQKRGTKVMVNDRAYKNLPDIYKMIIRAIVNHFEQVELENDKDLEKWLDGRTGKEGKYTVDGVLLEFENGDEYAIPLFLFSEEDLEFLKPSYERWTKAEYDKEKRAYDRFMLEAETRAYQLERQKVQIQQMQLGLLAVATGIVWEVCIEPKPGVVAYPQCVVVAAGSSAEASAKVLANFPAYQVATVRRVR
jgi:hypothetical protein